MIDFRFLSRLRVDGSPVPRGRWIAGVHVVIAVLVMSISSGCASETGEAKASHFEHDHEVAAHWPEDLSDVAIKIRQRLDWIESGQSPVIEPDDKKMHGDDINSDDMHDGDSAVVEHEPVSEIVDLISWTAEVAADTDLSETDWLPLYRQSESLMGNVRDATKQTIQENRSEIEAFCQMIDTASASIPDLYSNVEATE